MKINNYLLIIALTFLSCRETMPLDQGHLTVADGDSYDELLLDHSKNSLPLLAGKVGQKRKRVNGKFICPRKRCNAHFKTQQERDAHFKTHDNKTCHGCDRTFSSAQYRRKHARTCQSIPVSDDAQQLLPEHGTIQPLLHETLSGPVLSNDNRPECDLCGNRFNQRGDLNRHITRVHGKFICEKKQCNTYFDTEQECNAHFQTHDNKTCYGCKRTFASMQYLTKHLEICKNIHAPQQHIAPTQEQQFECSCGQRYILPHHFENHKAKCKSARKNNIAVGPTSLPYAGNHSAHTVPSQPISYEPQLAPWQPQQPLPERSTTPPILHGTPSSVIPPQQVINPAILFALRAGRAQSTHNSGNAIQLEAFAPLSQAHARLDAAWQPAPNTMAINPLLQRGMQPAFESVQELPLSYDDAAPVSLEHDFLNDSYLQSLPDHQDNDIQQLPAHDATAFDCNPDEFLNLQ